ncbi:MAG: HDOD domain-containing protein [Candidatus Thiodiazotropha sp. (ex Monitilora ramsayi)]|nr:HDOD domain-containing protein [Candidatus Thiodiazotropha sp. (ex Monitilora ramsayi)]
MTLPHTIVREADLPSPSPILNHLFDMMFDPNTSLDDLADTISTDAGLSARTLRSANAAFSSPEQKIENVRDAVVRIGLITTIHILTATEIKAVFFSVPGHHGDMQQLWRHNLVTACIADAYAHHYDFEKPARWFTGGLLHDIGRLVLLRHDPVKYTDAVAREISGEQAICDAEREIFGISHEEVGAELMTLWQFPDEIAEAAYHHDQPFVSHDDFRTGICIANELAKALESDEPLPKHDDFSAEKIIAEAGEKYEVMKKASGTS